MRNLLPIVLTVLSAAACTTTKVNSASSSSPELATYEVPTGWGPRVQAVLSRLLHSGEGEGKPVGRVSASPDGRVVVVAPRDVQSGIATFLEGLKNKQLPGPQPTVRMQYWVVAGVPADEMSVGPALSSVSDALETVTATDGKMKFSLIEKIDLRSLSDERAQTSGTAMEVAQTASVVDGMIQARVSVSHMRGDSELDTTVSFRPDQTLVLGATGLEASLLPPAAGAPALDASVPVLSLYYLVRASIDGGAGA